jgi:aspartate/methionine/tyrosine aminotransferase
MSRWNSPRCPRPFDGRLAGWLRGRQPRLIAALTRVKSYLDYGAFTPIQAAACAALNGPQDIVEANRVLYQKRRDVLVESFRPGRLGHSQPQGIDVRLGTFAARAEGDGQP